MNKIIGGLALLMLMSCAASAATTTVDYTVTTASYGNPVIGATVTLANASYGQAGTTDANGWVRLTVTQSKDYDLTVAATGYDTVTSRLAVGTEALSESQAMAWSNANVADLSTAAWLISNVGAILLAVVGIMAAIISLVVAFAVMYLCRSIVKSIVKGIERGVSGSM
jgi:hypothetical protein